MLTLRVYSQLSHLTCIRVNCIYLFVHYILNTCLSHDWKFIPFDCLHSIHPDLTSPNSGNYKSDLLSHQFICSFIFEIVTCNTVLVPVMQEWFGISVHFKLFTRISLVKICYHTKTWHSYWLYFPPVYYIPVTHLFCN